MPTVTGDINKIAGAAVTSGEVRFTATSPVVQDPNAKTTSLATSVAQHAVPLTGTGTISTTLPVTGADWVYRVEISAYVDGNRVQGLPRLLLDVPATGADLSDAGVEGAQSGRVIVNRMVGTSELSAALAPIRATAADAVAIAEDAVSTVEAIEGPISTRLGALEVLGGLEPGDVSDATVQNLITQEGTSTRTALNAAIGQSAVTSSTVARIVATDDPATVPAENELVLVYQGPRRMFEQFDDGLIGLTPRWKGRADWQAGAGDITIPASGTTGTRRRALSFDQVGSAEADVEVMAEFVRTGTQAALACGVALRGRTEPNGAETGIVVGVSSDFLTAWTFVAGVATNIPGVTVAITSGTAYRLRARIDGNRLTARIWASSDPEPTVWQMDTTATAVPSPGWVGLASSAMTPAIVQAWRWASVGTQGQTAVIP